MSEREYFVGSEPTQKAIEENPHVFIQWKGTDACLDIRCPCGAASHYDGDFAYAVRCPQCKQVWILGCYVQLYPLPQGELEENHCVQEAKQ